MDKAQTATTTSKQQEETTTYAGFHSLITGENRSWEYGGDFFRVGYEGYLLRYEAARSV